MARTKLRISKNDAGFVLIERDPKTNEKLGLVNVGPVEELRDLAEALNDTADAFEVVGKLNL